MASTQCESPPPTTPYRPSRLRRVSGLILGWCLVVAGIILMPLPGPGTLVVVAGLRILVPHHRWAAAAYESLKWRASAAATASVATWSRVLASMAGVGWLAALTGVYALDVQVRQIEIAGLTVGPGLPFHSVGAVLGLAASTAATAVLLLWTVARWGPHRTEAPRAAAAPGKDDESSTGLAQFERPDVQTGIEAQPPRIRVAPPPSPSSETTRCGRSAGPSSRKRRGVAVGPCRHR